MPPFSCESQDVVCNGGSVCKVNWQEVQERDVTSLLDHKGGLWKGHIGLMEAHYLGFPNEFYELQTSIAVI